jgi:3-methyladenine DNA glycosylase AlkC
MTNDLLNRKGARKPAEVPRQVLELLERGELESVNLAEWLAVDHVKLLDATFPALGLGDTVPALKKIILELRKPTALKITKAVGTYLAEHANGEKETTFDRLSTHTSDAVRAYAPFLWGLDHKLSVDRKLERSMVCVSDTHFGVRELTWMALRPAITDNLSLAIPYLENWTRSMDENVRRFTTEATRPRGVWCKHIAELKEHPELAQCLLDPLKSDASRYVQNSVGNWLNDAGKSRPDFVLQLTEKWMEQSNSPATAYIVKRGRRNL